MKRSDSLKSLARLSREQSTASVYSTRAELAAAYEQRELTRRVVSAMATVELEWDAKSARFMSEVSR